MTGSQYEERERDKARKMTFNVLAFFPSTFYGDIKLTVSIVSSIIHEQDFPSKCTHTHTHTHTHAHTRDYASGDRHKQRWEALTLKTVSLDKCQHLFFVEILKTIFTFFGIVASCIHGTVVTQWQKANSCKLCELESCKVTSTNALKK